MKYKERLLEGTLLQRYKRFFADVEHEGQKYTIHVPNTGSLKGVIDKNMSQQKCWFSLHGDETKKLKGTLEAVQAPNGTWVGINTSNPNRIVQEAILAGLENKMGHLNHWREYGFYKSEFKISKESRLDGVFCHSATDLDDKNVKKHFIEIKNTTFVGQRGNEQIAMFPDTVTERGQKHIEEMMKLMKQGHVCELIFAIQREDVTAFSPADELDPVYTKLLRIAMKAGLIVSPIQVHISRDEVVLTKNILPVLIDEK